MNANTKAIIAAALECYARQLERDAKAAGNGTATWITLTHLAASARHLRSLLEHGSTLP